jgi:hypothetical protein
VRVTLRSGRRTTVVRVQVSWCCRLSGPAAARLLAVAGALVLAVTAIAMSAHGELTRAVLYLLAGFLTALRPGRRS